MVESKDIKKYVWKCLDYDPKKLKELTLNQLKAMALCEYATCHLESPPWEFGMFIVNIEEALREKGLTEKEVNDFIHNECAR